MKLGLQLGYWGAGPPANHRELVAAAEDAGFDAIFTAEAWGSDAFTPLAWWGRETTRLRLGTSIVQMSGRSPTSIAMHALTLDHLSNGRVVLGMGVSGPSRISHALRNSSADAEAIMSTGFSTLAAGEMNSRKRRFV